MKLRTGKIVTYKSSMSSTSIKKNTCVKRKIPDVDVTLRNGKVITKTYTPFAIINMVAIYQLYLDSHPVSANRPCLYDEDCIHEFTAMETQIKALIKEGKTIVRYSSRIPIILKYLETLSDNIHLFFSPVIIQDSRKLEYCKKQVQWIYKLLKHTHNSKTLERYTICQLNEVNNEFASIYSLWKTIPRL